MPGFADRFVQCVTERARSTVLILLALSLVSLSWIVDFRTGEPRIILDPSVDGMLPRDDPDRIYFDHVKQVFESGETILVVLVVEDVFTPDNLARIRRMSERLESLDEVHHVSSLATAVNIRSEAGTLRVALFFDAVPADPASLADLRRRALEDPIYAGNLISRDGRKAALVVSLLDLPEHELLAARIDERVVEIAEQEKGDGEIWVTGGAHVKTEISRLMVDDLRFVLPASLLVMAIVAYLSFRSFVGVFAPMAIIGMAVLWCISLISMWVGNLNQVTVAVPPVLIVAGFAYGLHLLSAHRDVLRAGGSVDTAPALALREVAIPVFFTGLTTAAGFLSLTTSSLPAIQQFGFFCGVGVLATLFLALTLGPAMLSMMPVSEAVLRKERARGYAGQADPARGEGAKTARQSLAKDSLGRFLASVAQFVLRHGRAILWVGGLVALVALFGMARIQVGTDMVSNLKVDNPVRTDFERVNDSFEGANGFQIVLEATRPGVWQQPEFLRTLETLQAWLVEQPEIGGTTSLADYVKVIHKGFLDADNLDTDDLDSNEFEGHELGLRIPDSAALVSQLLVIGGNDEIDRFVDPDFSLASIAVRTTAMDSDDVVALVERIEGRLAETGFLAPGIAARVTGNAVLVSRTMDDIALGQALSLGTAFIIIYVILAILFTSLQVGLIALIPNALPVLIYFGILGWTGVSLNTTTGLVACLILGIAVDDTIHMLAHFNKAAKRRADPKAGIIHAICVVGRPVTYSSAALCLGFATLLASGTYNQIHFGWLAAVTLACAWLIDLTFTAAVAVRMKVVTLWDVLALDLGEDPRTTIPLFAGLRPGQARIAALLMSIRRYPAGHHLCRAGDRGDDMFVVIDGTLEAVAHTQQGSVLLRKLHRGDVVGEVALFHGIRSADVRALTDVRLLRLTEADLDRLRRRHPWIGIQIFANLNRVLAERLAQATPGFDAWSGANASREARPSAGD